MLLVFTPSGAPARVMKWSREAPIACVEQRVRGSTKLPGRLEEEKSTEVSKVLSKGDAMILGGRLR